MLEIACSLPIKFIAIDTIIAKKKRKMVKIAKTPQFLLSAKTVCQKRRKFFDSCTAFRLSHHEMHPRLTVDYYSGYLLFIYYKGFPTERLAEIAQEVAAALGQLELPVYGAVQKFRPETLSGIVDEKDSRIYHPTPLFGELPPPRFSVREYNLQFFVSFHEGYSTGLFLDIKHARQLVRQITKPGDEILNLFSYTGGFSIAAAKAGAARVIEVDTSAKWLRWARENQILNEVTVVRQRREDAVRFLHKQKDNSFDLIICDPPTYSTQKPGIRFTVEEGYREMRDDFHRVLRPCGCLLASTNYHGITREKFFRIFTRTRKFELAQEVAISEDFAGDDYLKVGLFRKFTRLRG
jgi:23S rRNA (cytosine1962-C5)-methyltransferase